MDADLESMKDIIRAFLRDSTSDTVAFLRDDGTFLEYFTGDSYVGRAIADVVGKNIADFVPADVAQRMLAALREVSVDGPAVLVEHVRRSPVGPREIRARLVRRHDGIIIAHLRDVTEARAAERQARENLERYTLLAEAACDPTFDFDVTTQETLWCGPLGEVFGYAGVSRTSREWWAERVHPADREATFASIAEAAADKTRRKWIAEYRFRAADGSYKDVVNRTVIVRDEHGRMQRAIGSMLDVTAQKELAARLERADRVLALGTLAAGVGHEVNGPLSYVVGNVALALEALEKGRLDVDELRRLLTDAQIGADRVRSVVTELKALARGDEAARDRVDVNEVVRVAIKMIDRGARVRVTSNGDAAVTGNAHRLGQIVTNLVTNALEALDPARADGAVTVRVEGSATCVRLVVEDNGRGVSEADAARMFDPFFTTRASSGGTGLGLAVAHAVVSAHHGHIEVERLARGTRFTVSLPPADVNAPATPAPVPTTVPCQRKRVLVVDDDELTLKLVRFILHEHDVTAVADADAALSAFRTGTFDLVLSDVVMPRMNGGQLRDAVQALGRPVKFAFLSAGAPEQDMSRLVPVLLKPFTPEALRSFVRSL